MQSLYQAPQDPVAAQKSDLNIFDKIPLKLAASASSQIVLVTGAKAKPNQLIFCETASLKYGLAPTFIYLCS